MTAVNRNTLYSYFTTGSRPSQQQFANLIDSCFNLIDTSGQVIAGDITVSGNADIGGSMNVVGAAAFRSDVLVSGNLSVTGSFAPASQTVGALTVTGLSTLNTLTISGIASAQSLNVAGQATFASAKARTPTLGSSSTDIATTAFVNPDSVLGTTGSRKNPDGSIYKWGTAATSAGGTSAVVFTSAFPNNVYQVFPAANSSSNLAVVTFDTPTVNGFNISGWDAGGARGAVAASWNAIGN